MLVGVLARARRSRSGSAWSGRWWWRTCCAGWPTRCRRSRRSPNRLPGTAAGSLAGALGAKTIGEGGAPGVLDALSGAGATAWTAGYLVVCVAASLALVARRDLL